MLRSAWVLAALVFIGSYAPGWPQDKTPESPKKFPDGVYAVLRGSLKEKDVLPLKEGEMLMVHHSRYLKQDEKEPPRFLVVHSAPDLVLDLAGEPKAVKEGMEVVRIFLKLQPKAATALERLTRDHLGREVTIVLGAEVVTMHKIREVIKGGELQITCCAAGAANYLLEQLQAPRPVNASEAILNAFDKYRVVALGEAHGLQEEHDFIQSLIQNPAFATKVNDIVVECGNALYQDILDRYIAGQDVPMAEVRHVWRNTTQSAVGLWNALVYEQLFTSVRELNKNLPVGKRLRVLAGDPPIDWKNVRRRSDADTFLGQRDTHFASVVERQVLAKNRKALLIIGTVHLFKARPGSTPGANGSPPPPEPALAKGVVM